MELSQAVNRLSALAQTARLQVFRLLVRTGPQGMPAGEIATELDIPAQTLSFHLKHLANAGLIESRREGRSLIYSLQVASMQQLLAFLSEDCCQGRRELCVPLGNSAKARSAAISPKPERPTVLFLCSQNSARSQIAEALLKKRANSQFHVHSAGLRPSTVDPLTLKVLQEVGIDTSACKAQDFGEFLGKVPIDYGIVVCDRADQECTQMFPFAVKRLYWPFEDPAACTGSRQTRLNKFREVRDAIDKRLRQWLTERKQTRELAS
jgi:protein-tyrosine-phosphatase/DNA-binding transcriptional ArsR family regulator